jgi:hypothetical protein
MTRLRKFILGLASAGALIGMMTGCDLMPKNEHRNKPVDLSGMKPASTETAARVDVLGRKLLAGSPFLFAQEPSFQIIGVPEPELFHRDSTGLFITEGLVKKCESEAELAAVLASELGHMVAEQRRTDRMKLPDPIPPAALPRGVDGTTDLDPGRAIELADLELNYRKPAERRILATTDPKTIAENCLNDAGFDPKVLKKVEPLIRAARRNQTLAQQLAPPANQGNWLR